MADAMEDYREAARLRTQEEWQKREAAILATLREDMPDVREFDWAIPLEQFKRLNAMAGQNVTGHVVTAYGPTVGGRIMGITDKGREWVALTWPEG